MSVPGMLTEFLLFVLKLSVRWLFNHMSLKNAYVISLAVLKWSSYLLDVPSGLL